MMDTATADVITTGPWIDGEIQQSEHEELMLSPYDQRPVARVFQASAAQVETAIQGAVEAFAITRHSPAHERHRILSNIAHIIEREHETLAQGISAESGKPITAARGEVDRAVYVFDVAAEEAKRLGGELVGLDWLPGNEQREAQVRRVARGPVAGITPFNFPLNLVAHKVAPALAAGNPILIKPAPQAVLTAIHLGRILVEAGWPAKGVAVLPCANEQARPLITDDRIKLLTFTGSPTVGWWLKGIAGRKPVTLELGGNAGNIVCADSDIDYAVGRIAWGGFVNAGQACISVQRVYVEAAVYERFKQQLLDKVATLKFGDPALEETVVGPVINEAAADRIMASIESAVAAGAKVLIGGKRDGLVVAPTVVESDDESLAISRTEIFGPVIVLSAFNDFKQVVARVNDSDYGLQAGLFCRDMGRIHYAAEQLDVGGLNVNDVSTFRIDHMPYGGVKGSGFGREGLRYAIEEMTEMKLITFNYTVFNE